MTDQPDFRYGEDPSGPQEPSPYGSPSGAQPSYGSPTPQASPAYGYADPNPQGYGYQQPGYGQPQPGYGQPQAAYGMQPYQQAYPYGSAQPDHPQSQMVFILGIVGIFTGITAFVAWYMGGQAKKEIEAGAPYQWGGQLKTGYTLGKVFGILSIVGWSLLIVIYAAYFIFLFAMLGGM